MSSLLEKLLCMLQCDYIKMYFNSVSFLFVPHEILKRIYIKYILRTHFFELKNAHRETSHICLLLEVLSHIMKTIPNKHYYAL